MEAGAGIRRIEVPVPFPLRTANAWLLQGARPTLIDCGIGTPEGYDALRRGLWDSGADANGVQVLLTHGHVDHAGNAARLRREFGAQVLALAEEAPMVTRFREDSARRLDAYGEALALHGVPPEAVAAMRQRGEALDHLTEDVPLGRALRDGQRIEAGDATLTVRRTPGHTEGSALFELDGRTVATGDTLLQHITSNAIELTDADRGRYRTYLRTLDGLRRHAGCTALPGHHAPFAITDALLDGHLAKHRERSRRVLEALDVPRTAWELLPRVLPHLAEGKAFLAVCEVVGHLHALEADGLARAVESGGVRRFVRR